MDENNSWLKSENVEDIDWIPEHASSGAYKVQDHFVVFILKQKFPCSKNQDMVRDRMVDIILKKKENVFFLEIAVLPFRVLVT